ncbi:hypothetical protein FRC11_014975, partial [Ceratobasidium sp. 423]
MASRLNVSVKEIEAWGPVIRATAALQMHDTRKFIFARLDEDSPNITCNVAMLLRLSLDYEEAPRSLLLECLRILVCRRKRLTPDEVHIIGGEGACLVNHAREDIRESLSGSLVQLLQESKKVLGTNGQHAECLTRAYSDIIENLRDNRPQTMDNVFQDISSQALCDSCTMSQAKLGWLFTMLSNRA